MNTNSNSVKNMSNTLKNNNTTSQRTMNLIEFSPGHNNPSMASLDTDNDLTEIKFPTTLSIHTTSASNINNTNTTTIDKSISDVISTPRAKNDFNSITDALVQVESLRMELERVQMGLTLMGLSVDKLIDIISTPPPCCPSFFDFMLPNKAMIVQAAGGHERHAGVHTANIKMISSSSIGNTTRNMKLTNDLNNNNNSHNRTSSQLKNTNQSLTTSSSVASAVSISSSGTAKLQEIFHTRKIKKDGYKNIGANTSLFSIDGHDEDDDDDI